MSVRLLFCAVVAGLSTQSAVTCLAESRLADVDFSVTNRCVDVRGVGSFVGVLPPGVSENFTGWSGSRVKAEVREEGGLSFWHVETEVGSGQFVLGESFIPGDPGCYRLVVKARAISDAISLGLRLVGSPYKSLWSERLLSPEWTDREYVFHVDRRETRPVALFFWTPAGGIDIAAMRLSRVDDAEFAARIRRPPPDVDQFLLHTRFPLGMPNGWNVIREALTGDVTSEGHVLVADPKGCKPFGFWTEPFQSNRPKEPHVIEVEYRADGDWRMEVVTDHSVRVVGMDLGKSADWRKVPVRFDYPALADACAINFLGEGRFFLRSISARPADAADKLPPAVALAPCGGAIAERTRVFFADESATVRYGTIDAPAGSELWVEESDVHDRTRTVYRGEVDPKGGTFAWVANPSHPYGQFRLTAHLMRNGRQVAPVDELVLERVARPLFWGRDAPDSPFGAHFLARTETIQLMKACGVNWARFHDASTELSGWAHLEPEKGKWRWRDEDIRRYRENDIRIFAQLGTAPAWATHYGDLGCRKMGYFERYLRPTNMVDCVNYVTRFVSRYRGVIDDYFIWNEPWTGWWSSALDIKYYDKARAGYDFGVFSKAVYAAAKAANPSARVCGINTYNGDGGRKWTDGVVSGGGYKACDDVDYHYYAPVPRLRFGRDEKTSWTPFAGLRKSDPDLGGRRLIMSEGMGYATFPRRGSGLYRATVPWAPETAEESVACADATCRYVISLLAEGVDRVYLYSAHCYVSLGVVSSFTQLVGADGYASPVHAAHAHMARTLEGKRFKSSKAHGARGGKWVFEGPSGKCAVFAGLSKEEALAVASVQGVRVTDIFGNPIARETYIPGSLVYAIRNGL